MGEVAEFSKGQGYSKADLCSSGIPAFLYGQMYTDYKLLVTESNQHLPQNSDGVFSTAGDVIIPASGESPEEIAIASVIGKTGILLGGDLNIIKPEKSILDSIFLALSASGGRLHGSLVSRAQGKTIVHLHNSDIAASQIRYPTLPEQRRIGTFFSALDSLIAAAERQEDLLKQKKQAYLQLMFPREGETQPRLRFSGFSKDWEQRRSSEQFVPVKENGHSDLPVLSATQSEGMVYRDDQSRDIKFKTDNLSSYKLVRAGDFVISLRSFQGGFELSDKTGIVSPAYTVFTHAECSSQDNAYWKQYFKRKSFIESLKTVTFGIRDGKTISFSDFSSLKCIFPSLPEQRRIGEFFTTLDNLIAATEERTRALKEMKSAYLQRMFV
ncbi:type I restriction enzyme S subunit [Pseudoscardovia suis]|uniref:Type I site-specific deoxyribonuclease n=1 Tax=Pseudoscardovia suis TaxID=987063 RepID=A0A261ERQ2_9BIFI|nr:Type I site-specific deoxyribonuclease [Pseudoscardovia suis]PJJ69659.1 type I restriction enzyme S subunit [Pseudoscardovia suis]